MSQPAIEVSGLSKRYVIQHESRHDNLRDTLHHSARKLWRRLRWGTGFETEEFWALRDVSFSVQPGEVLGIIGRNGAGKSTLLKVLSRITEPTAGQIKLRGRVASLLEVGTGFHPELSGRENIFLNGAILGMSRVEIRGKFDEIVAFAEVERFLDTPVKRYSSGMYVRLAFAVAAHLEPDILIVDEVLAVGDIAFQQKCLGKMREVSTREGRTVLFVSHNLDSMYRLCQRVLWLQQGQMAADGPTSSIIGKYTSTTRSHETDLDLNLCTRPRDCRSHVRFTSLSHTPTELTAWSFPFGITNSFKCTVQVVLNVPNIEIAYAIFTTSGFEIASNRVGLPEMQNAMPGVYTVEFRPHLQLAPGNYTLNLAILSANGVEDIIKEAASFEIVPSLASAAQYGDSIRAAIIPELTVSVSKIG